MTHPSLHLAAAQDALTLAEQGVIEQDATIADLTATTVALRADVTQAHAQLTAALARIDELEALLPKPPGVLMGVDWSAATRPEPNYHEGTWPAYRAYTRAQAVKCWDTATVKPSVVVVSDDKALPVVNYANVGTALHNFMTDWNSVPERAKCRVVWVWRNEIFNEYTAAIPVQVVDGFRLSAQAAAGFDNCDVGVNGTTWTVTNGDAAQRWRVVAPHITVGTCSMYPPGRVKSPPVFTPPAAWCDPVLDMFADWGVSEFMIGETGIPVDRADQVTGQPVGGGDWTRRPTYLAGLLQHLWDGCEARGIAFTAACYWNRQKQVVAGEDHPPNQFKHDQGRPGGNTADAWFGWAPA